MEEGKITKALLKTRSGEFELESIHSINLRELGISDLGCIGECTGLERANLSRNEITKLTKLAGLTNLAILNLSANRIMSLEGLQALDNLQSLNLAGNLIGGVENLRCLTGLDKLESLTVNDKTLSNPFCINQGYKKDIAKMFPRLRTIDGERLHGRGSEVFEMCKDIEEALEMRSSNSGDTKLSKVEEWLPDNFWTFSSRKFDQTNLADADEQLQGLLYSCQLLSEKADAALSPVRPTSSSGDNS
ncbi:leucine-rich repeat-containing protein 61-like [Mizuhopecten yessoensis]|uniref:Leucine-rich repeat-containing protein 61 n=1 Tax=Mizuhopecten yessoensis TaxID=6573 RepID=A0A210QB59_MIZYE|nr:leucine-rich repeat-containing protein 61-like [Mizuhopecten yessoensis]OWF45968.1 Leucine-rich repeat-containing protein 61 [Mizuhopecten yessoensis]